MLKLMGAFMERDNTRERRRPGRVPGAAGGPSWDYELVSGRGTLATPPGVASEHQHADAGRGEGGGFGDGDPLGAPGQDVEVGRRGGTATERGRPVRVLGDEDPGIGMAGDADVCRLPPADIG